MMPNKKEMIREVVLYGLKMLFIGVLVFMVIGSAWLNYKYNVLVHEHNKLKNDDCLLYMSDIQEANENGITPFISKGFNG